MNKSTYPLKLPASIKAAAQRLAKAEGVSLNQFIAAAVAEKVGTLETADLFLKRKAGDARPQDLLEFIDNAPDVPPQPSDEPQTS
jgi:hypothetical protein